ncbi:nucleotidyl cyclase domain-containing protein [Deinococcus radiophilus]|uniref:Adenylate/guanylate cyclase domain-containing protein n=2 Tax=Deinococcus radiophilus TaxID=32062 RepID=A0A3S0KAQ3_9DEIO|nr:adenylate/guanylate cyclase domain-containing protein [Deinococcus radiophilus]RTR26514.1 adenylate/guanylate cyclase domain-containing protein [Deinococcus radiophilus]UFA50573.1 adenylate/guanylate cyclase domain-containing protein [Deinococcus radiophilus]
MYLTLPPIHMPQEQRYCVLILDLVGSTQLVQDLPLGLWSEVLGEWSTATLDLLWGWGGWVQPLQGDAALACWPQDQADAAVSAAHQAHSLARGLPFAEQLNVELNLRAGLAAGALMALPGDQPRLCGVPLHLAQRLCSAAQPGETLMCSQVAAGLEHDPGGQDSVLSPLSLPPLKGFEAKQCGGELGFFRLRTAHTMGAGQMKAG